MMIAGVTTGGTIIYVKRLTTSHICLNTASSAAKGMSLYLKIQERNLVTFLVWVVSMEVSDLANNLMDSDLLDNNHTGNRVMDRRHTDSSHTASNLMDNNRTCNNHLATGLTDKWHLVSSMDSSHLHNSLMLNNHNTVSNKDMGSKCSRLDKLDSLAVSPR